MAKNPFMWWVPEEGAKGAKTGKASKAAPAMPAKAKSPAKKAKPAPAAKPAAKKAAAKKPAGTPAKSPTKSLAKTPSQKMSASYSLADKPGHLIRRAQQIAVAIFLEECGDLTPVQYAALGAVAANPGVDATRIAGLVALDRTTISGVLERLEAKGLVARAASDSDRRAKSLEATASGRRLMAKVQPAVEAAQNRILAPLNRQERAQLMALLGKLVEANNDASRAPRRADD